MEEAIQSSIYVATPDYAGWLQKRGFAVSLPYKRYIFGGDMSADLVFFCLVDL